MIKLEDVLIIHSLLLAKFGGLKGIRDLNMLKSAIQRPYAGIGENEFYSSPEEKSAAIFESIISNHPFMDGNKRTAYVLMRMMLKINGYTLIADQRTKYDFVIKAASGKLNYDQILDWIKLHAVKI